MHPRRWMVQTDGRPGRPEIPISVALEGMGLGEVIDELHAKGDQWIAEGRRDAMPSDSDYVLALHLKTLGWYVFGRR